MIGSFVVHGGTGVQLADLRQHLVGPEQDLELAFKEFFDASHNFSYHEGTLLEFQRHLSIRAEGGLVALSSIISFCLKESYGNVLIQREWEFRTRKPASVLPGRSWVLCR